MILKIRFMYGKEDKKIIHIQYLQIRGGDLIGIKKLKK